MNNEQRKWRLRTLDGILVGNSARGASGVSLSQVSMLPPLASTNQTANDSTSFEFFISFFDFRLRVDEHGNIFATDPENLRNECVKFAIFPCIFSKI